jgi:hypothetical protein
MQIFRVKNNGQNLNPKDLFTQADKVVKIVRMEIKDGQNRKSMDLLAHEVDMFQLVRKRRSKEVIKIYDS